MNVNLNPVASGNKTQTGTGGILTIVLTAAVYAGLKEFGVDDTTGVITSAIIGAISSGGLFIWGLIHKAIKAKK